MIPCNSCGNLVQRIPSEIARNKTGKFYCSSSCAAAVNNRTAIKRKRKKSCPRCGSPVLCNHTYCGPCYRAKHYLSDKTIAEAVGGRKDANRYTGIRSNARKAYSVSSKPKCCAACGYSKHIQICHIRDIADFPRDTLISTVNHLDNLVALCPNHHWEFDHGHLVVGPTGLEPVTDPL